MCFPREGESNVIKTSAFLDVCIDFYYRKGTSFLFWMVFFNLF